VLVWINYMARAKLWKATKPHVNIGTILVTLTTAKHVNGINYNGLAASGSKARKHADIDAAPKKSPWDYH